MKKALPSSWHVTDSAENRNTEGSMSVVLGIYRNSVNRHFFAVYVVRYVALAPLALDPRSYRRVLLSRLGILNS